MVLDAGWDNCRSSLRPVLCANHYRILDSIKSLCFIYDTTKALSPHITLTRLPMEYWSHKLGVLGMSFVASELILIAREVTKNEVPTYILHTRSPPSAVS